MVSLTKKNSPGGEKAKVLLRKNINCVSFMAFLFILTGLIYYYGNKYKNSYEQESRKLNIQKKTIIKKTKETEDKIKIVAKFKQIWDTKLSEYAKKTTEITNEYIVNLIGSLEKNNLISTPKFEVSNPYNYKVSEYDSNIKTILQEIRINFDCISEHSVYNFIDDFKRFFNGFVILSSMEIKSLKDLDKVFVQNMANGKIEYLFNANITMYLYYIKL